MYRSGIKAREDKAPWFRIRSPSSKLTRMDRPGSEDIKSDVSKGRRRLQAIEWQIRHMLLLNLSSKSFTGYTPVD
jgi:hypothetical protein